MSLEHIASSTGTLDRAAVSRDLWPIGTLDFWQGIEAPYPERVFWPRNSEQVLELLRAASEASTVVVPYGAGSGVCGGARGRKGSWVL
ncbi:MAG: alkyldihydroxyacetonephosphate synthase, partial [Kiritimatiellia bacterium]